MTELKNIVDGWKNMFISDGEVEILTAERKKICLECPYKRKLTCAKCGCPLEAKLRAVQAHCPDNRWER